MKKTLIILYSILSLLILYISYGIFFVSFNYRKTTKFLLSKMAPLRF